MKGITATHVKEAIQAHVKDELVLYKCPREVEFVKLLLRTTTGKLQRFRL